MMMIVGNIGQEGGGGRGAEVTSAAHDAILGSACVCSHGGSKSGREKLGGGGNVEGERRTDNRHTGECPY